MHLDVDQALDPYAAAERRGLSSNGYRIWLDRYALKDLSGKRPELGELLLAPLPGRNRREIATVTHMNCTRARVRFHDGEEVEVEADQLDRPVETDPAQTWDRVARWAADGDYAEHVAFRNLLSDWRFLPGGRVLASAGGTSLSGSNCYVLPSPRDDRHEIFATLDRMAELFSRGGGVGFSLGSLRPRQARVLGVNGRSSGSVSWGGLYSFVTGLIEQGGSRRGALMLQLPDWHPDLPEFIRVKRELGQITNANISVNVSNAFMRAVEEDGDWCLEFPDTGSPGYDEVWRGDLGRWKAEGRPVKVWQRMPARALWDVLVESAHACGDPGLWFGERCNQLSNSAYYEDGALVCTNPCGEQPLPAWAVCNLGHVNLSRFLLRPWAEDADPVDVVDWTGLTRAVRDAVRFLDKIIDLQKFHIPECGAQQRRERRIGLGTMGLGEVLIRCGLRYGSAEAISFTREIMYRVAKAAYQESIQLGEALGPFPAFNECFWNRPFADRMSTILNRFDRPPIRNVCLMSQAPCGTVGTMAGTSTGVEPFFAMRWTRQGQFGVMEERAECLAEWMELHPGEPVPPFFAGAMDLEPHEHVRMQAACQEWTDGGVSKTINLPAHATDEDVRECYRLFWDLGCKGGTVYRDGCKGAQVLTEVKAEEEAVQSNTSPSPHFRPRQHRRRGETLSVDTPVGTAHVTLNRDSEGRPAEVFVEAGKGGSETKAMVEALGRVCCLLLRIDSPVPPEARVAALVEQLQGIGGPRPVGFGPARVSSLPDGVARALSELVSGSSPPEDDDRPRSPSLDLCPSCGSASVAHLSGCSSCVTEGCGWSAC